MAIVLSKLFMRTISQNPNENQTGISLWTLQDVEKAQRREQEFGDGGLDDGALGEIDLDV